MKTNFRLSALGAATFLMLGGLSSLAQAAAIGTASGTSITNTATANYDVGGIPQNPVCSSPTGNTTSTCTNTSFTVDTKINVTVATTDATAVSVVPGATAAVATFSVTNQGNSTQDFSLATNTALSGVTVLTKTDDKDPGTCNTYVESGATAGYQAGQDTATYIDELASGDSKTVYVVCAFPLASNYADDNAAAVSLTATARAGGTAGSLGGALTETTGAATSGVDTVFADGAGTDDTPRNADHSARDIFLIQTAEIKVTKTVATLCDPVNGNTDPKNIPGAVVQYTITLENLNTASSSASLTTLSDALSTNLTLDPDFIVGGSAATCVSGAGSVATSAAGNSFQVSKGAGTNGRASLASAIYKTSSAGDADGADLTTGTVNLNWATILPAEGTYTAAELKVGETVQVKFNAFIK